MKNGTMNLLFIFLFYVIFLIRSLTTKRNAYISAENLIITYYNSKYLANISANSQRYSRRDPLYYLNIEFETLRDIDNNASIHYYAVQYPGKSNILFELRYRWCDLIYKDEMIGPVFRKHLPPACPTPKGVYKIFNMTTAGISGSFIEHLPFMKARLHIDTKMFNEKLLEVHLNLEIKRFRT